MINIELNPFLHYSKQLQALLTKASSQKNPALWLYKNDVRTVLFMLEALTRLHDKAFDERLFSKWNKRFKKLEDLFGEIDQFIALESELKLNKKVRNETLKFFAVNATNLIEKCNQRLRNKDWFDNKLGSFDYKLSEFNVDYNDEYIHELKQAMHHEIDDIINLCSKSNFKFTKIEEEVHEMRRKLRWLSIYAQALNGLIQLKTSSNKGKFQINYFTKDVLNSPYNRLPARHKNTSIIEFDSDSFFALSWMIKELGTLKDEGLKVQKLADAMFIVDEVTREQSLVKAINVFKLDVNTQGNILTKSSKLLETFVMKDKILEKLIIE